MSTIVDHQIWDLVHKCNLISDFNPDQLNPASYDVRLGAEILVEGIAFGPEDMRKRWRSVSIEQEPYIMSPGEFVLGFTKEYIRVPSSLEAVFQLKSSRGREGYEHALAGYIDPGFCGQVTLELSNLNQRHSLPLAKDMLIGQLRFMKVDAIPSRSYAETGHYQGDIGVQPSKAALDYPVEDMFFDLESK
jgi:dCTP deaminase